MVLFIARRKYCFNWTGFQNEVANKWALNKVQNGFKMLFIERSTLYPFTEYKIGVRNVSFQP